MPSAPRARPETRRHQGHDEEEPSGPEPSRLAESLASAAASGDAVAACALLDTLVVRRTGGAVGPDGSSPVEELVPAPTSAAYRDAAPMPLVRALGDEGGARLLVHLLRNADTAGRAGQAVQELAAYLRDHEALARAVGAQILAREPRLVPHLPAFAPDLAVVDPGELRALAEAPPDELVRALPRIALTPLPRLARKKRKGLSPLVHRIAAVHDAHAPEALRALARAGVPMDRKHRGKLPREVAAEAGALANLRLLESLEAPAPTEPPRPRASKASRKWWPEGPVSPAWTEPAKSWWEAEVRFEHVVAIVTVIASLSMGILMGSPWRVPALLGCGVLVAIGLFGLWFQTRPPPRRRRGRQADDD